MDQGYTKDDIVALRVTNQRKTTIAWDKYTGEPLHAAIAWNDILTDSTVDGILAKIPDRSKNYFKSICGLPIAPYFSTLKMRWMKDNVKEVRRASRDKRLLFGTVDSWIVWNMTGGPHGGLHITDVTNASRTLLMNLETFNWDPILMTIICGLTAFTTKNHIIRAALEAVYVQTRDMLEAMNKDCGMPLVKLHVDGRMTSNDLLMQLQADLTTIPVLRSQAWDMAALGVAVIASGALGVWSTDKLRTHATLNDTFLPTTTDDNRDARYTKWKMAVQRSLGWATTKKKFNMTGQAKRKCSMMPQQQSLDVPSQPDSRKNSLFEALTLLEIKNDKNFDEGTRRHYVEELLQYSAHKFSMFVPNKKPVGERTILDDIDYFMSKNECDYGMCDCCPIEVKKVQTNWESIDEIIENDPEIIFDCNGNPIMVEPVKSHVTAEPVFLISPFE